MSNAPRKYSKDKAHEGDVSDAKAKRPELSVDKCVRRALERRGPDPKTIYHYTQAGGVAGILKSRQLRATSHRFTNDTAEFAAIDRAFRLSVTRAIAQVPAREAKVLGLALDHYPSLRAANVTHGFLTSFSTQRDVEGFWASAYTGFGTGFCLGVRVLSAPDEALEVPGWALFSGHVVYSDAERATHLDALIRDLSRVATGAPPSVPDSVVARQLASGVLRGTAAFAWLTKTSDWAWEQEWRRIAFANGFEVDARSVDLPARTKSRRVRVSEIITGPLVDFDNAKAWLEHVLRDAGYVPGSEEWPTIVRSRRDLG